MDKYLESIKNNELPIITFRSFEKFDGVTHEFTTRLGGVSKGIFSSMNLSFQRGDNYEDVMKNYEIIGNGVAAAGCIEGIRTADKDAKLTLISEEKYPVYCRPLISYYLEGKNTLEKMNYRD